MHTINNVNNTVADSQLPVRLAGERGCKLVPYQIRLSLPDCGSQQTLTLTPEYINNDRH